MLSTLNDVGKIEILSVIPSDEIGIDFEDEISPSYKEVLLSFKTVHLSSNNLSAAFQSENIPNDWLRLTMHLNDIRNLNYGILIRSRKFAFFCRAFYIKRHNPQRRNF